MGNVKATRATERAGVNYVRTTLDSINQIVQETSSSNDFGEDLYVNLVENDSRTGDLILIQVKSGPSYKRSDGYRIPVGDHLEFWKNCNVPIFGVVYDVDEEVAYWVNISEYLATETLSSAIKVARVPERQLTRTNASNFISHAIEFCANWHRASRPLIARRLQAASSNNQRFVGRMEARQILHDFLHEDAYTCAIISGIAGTGKTALAQVSAADAINAFPGGVIFIDMHGFATSSRRGQARDAYRTLLMALGLDSADIPDRHGEQAALYHLTLHMLAETNKPVLVVFDNVADPSQVVDLIPSSPPHKALVTSREKLSYFVDAYHLLIPELAPTESATLLEGALEATSAKRTVNTTDPEVIRLSNLCGNLPLALRISAGILAEDPHLSIADLNAELAERRSALDVLQHGDLAVRAALITSYARLPQDRRHDFTSLAIIPSPEFALSSAATVWQSDQRTARQNLRRLAETLLIEPAGAPERWRMHDLVYAFAEEQLEDVSPEKRSAATASLMDLFVEHVQNANWQLRPDRGEEHRAKAFANAQDAISWFGQELSTLTELIERGFALGEDGTENAYLIAMNLVEYLGRTRQADRAVYVGERALDAAKQLKDVERQCRALNNLGLALTAANRLAEARQKLLKAVAIAERRGYRKLVAGPLISLSAVQRGLEGPAAAIPTLQQAVSYAFAVGEDHGIAAALTNLGMAYREAGRNDLAVQTLQQALPFHHASRDHGNTGSGYTNLGLALTAIGHLTDAVQAFKLGMMFYKKAYDRHGEACAELGLGRALARKGNISEAKPFLRSALTAAQELADKRLEGEALMEYGHLARVLGDLAAADRYFSLSAAAYEDAGYTDAASALEEIRRELHSSG